MSYQPNNHPDVDKFLGMTEDVRRDVAEGIHRITFCGMSAEHFDDKDREMVKQAVFHLGKAEDILFLFNSRNTGGRARADKRFSEDYRDDTE